MVAQLPNDVIGKPFVRRLAASVTGNSSPFDMSEQVQDWGGRRWEYDITLAVQTGRDGRRLSAFFAALGGRAGAFLVQDPTINNPPQSGTVVVAGAGQSGKSLAVSGLVEQNLLAGDFIHVGSGLSTRLHQLTEDVVVTNGAATFRIEPALRYAPANGSAVEVNTPLVLLRSNAVVPVTVTPGDKFRFSFSAAEAL